MRILEEQLYHIYNQGNNGEQVFYTRENYLYFLRKYRQHVSPYCDTLAYCLMPNHFHFLIYAEKKSVTKIDSGHVCINVVSNGFRLLLSQYAHSLNKQKSRTGSLFRQKTKAKLLDDSRDYQGLVCLHYIHQNPLRAGLVTKLEDWEFSSFRDFAGLRKGTLSNNNSMLRKG
ncbi:MAG: transposase [Cytophagales bacterium]|nr:transposase [Cytophagales bacterium]